ncbi:copper resistance CopC/CopD family protein [Pannonibacter sp.]|uniref:copper resistance CopC/CopD family protein n=1 Tax=Pannonibacter sp. TaxID=1906786 RepID=UPI003F6F9797
MLARLFLLITFVFMPAAALAHAQLQTASPQEASLVFEMPAELMLVFNEPVSPLRILWVSPDGQQADVSASGADTRLTIPVPMAASTLQGTHLISWRVVSADGHPVSGTLSFSYGRESALEQSTASGTSASSIAVVAARAALSLTLAFGTAGLFGAALLRQNSRVALMLTWLTLPAAVGLVAAYGLDLTGAPARSLLDPSLWRSALSTPLALTTFFAAASAVLAIASGPSLPGTTLALVLAGLSFALSGHAAGAEPRTLMAPAMALHATIALFWAGTLPVLFVRAVNGTLSADELARYSRFALPLVIMLLVTGVVLAAVQLGRPEGLLGSNYGTLLMVKLGLVAGLLLLALINRILLTPRLAAPSTAHQMAARRQLRLTLAAELLLVAVILTLVAGFRLTPPPRALPPAAPTEVAMHLHGPAAMADVRLVRQDDGLLGLFVVLMDADGAPLLPKDLTGSLSNPEAGIVGLKLSLARQPEGTYVAQPVALPLPEGWVLQLDVLINDFKVQKLVETLPALP